MLFCAYGMFVKEAEFLIEIEIAEGKGGQKIGWMDGVQENYTISGGVVWYDLFLSTHPYASWCYIIYVDRHAFVVVESLLS